MQGFALFNQRTNPVCLLPFATNIKDETFDFGAADVVDEAGFNRRTPGGNSSMTDTSKSAKKLMASVRGMGVADIIN